MQRRIYTSVENYLLTAHSGRYDWVFQIQEMAKHWPKCTPEIGKQAQQECTAKAFECAKRIDRNNGIEVVIDTEEAVGLKE